MTHPLAFSFTFKVYLKIITSTKLKFVWGISFYPPEEFIERTRQLPCFSCCSVNMSLLERGTEREREREGGWKKEREYSHETYKSVRF